MQPLQLSKIFIRNINNSFGEAGKNWLVELPDLIQFAVKRWNLSYVLPVENLSYNFVAFARQGNNDVVLKIAVPNREFVSETYALKYFDGDGCVRLLDYDLDHHMFIIERLHPGEMLVTVKDDEQATQIACDVMTRLWRPAPEGLPFIKLSEWFEELKKLRPMFGGGTGPFPKQIFERVEALIPELFATSSPPQLLHGDFHHYNVLSSERGWLVIDAKGVIGSPEYEPGPLLLNPWDDFLKIPDARHITGRRIAILSERLGFSRERIRDWGMCHAILSAFWDLAEDGSGGEYSMACAEIIAGAKI